MSLLRVREFWSLELEQLVSQSSLQDHEPVAQRETNGGAEEGIGNFVASWGQFDAIGPHQVLVCANINGFICIVQVPEDRQPNCSHKSMGGSLAGAAAAASSPAGSLGERSRQVLLASQLGQPIVDVKCGHFTSTTKQSIAALSCDHLVVYHVKHHQADLMTPAPSSSSSPGAESANFIDDSLLSHQLEEQYRIALRSGELAAGLLVLGANPSALEADGSVTRSSRLKGFTSLSTSASNLRESSVGSASKQNAPLLPQRDQLVVQYTNQLTFSLIDYRRTTGHFRSTQRASHQGNASESRLQRLDLGAQFLGPMPMAYLHETKAASMLALTLSDHKIRCVAMDKLLAQAKQNVVQRMAKNLLVDRTSGADSNAGRLDQVAGAAMAQESWIDIDLDSMATWKSELPREPLQMQSIRRATTQPANQGNSSSTSQLLVMTRYTLDLFSSAGEHLWSQRSEEPLICFFAYTLAPTLNPPRPNEGDRLLTVICSDCLSNDKCNLSIFDDDSLVWSALLDSKPVQIWRTNLNKTSHVLASLDINQAKVSASYLGTNMMDINDAGDLDGQPDDSPDYLAQLELIDEPLFGLDRGSQLLLGDDDNGAPQGSASLESSAARALDIDTKLEASNQWPNVRVDSCISLRASNNFPSSSSVVLHNLIATLEFDDLIRYKATNQTGAIISPGVVQMNLGTYWPDKGEPLELRGQFTFRCNSSIGSGAIAQVDEEQQLPMEPVNLEPLLPKSLQVKLYLRFSDTRLGPAIQEHSFRLPLNLVGRLVHIDYNTIGSNQSLSDVLCNLQLYKRTQSLLETDDNSETPSPYYVVDTFIRISGDILEILDEIIESDLVCRGLNVESESYKVLDRKGRRGSTLENINLLAQSLDCRLKFKHQSRESRKSLSHQTSDDNTTVSDGIVMASMALELPASNCIVPGPLDSEANFARGNNRDAITWLHLIDLTAVQSAIPEQFVRQHMREWQVFEARGEAPKGASAKREDSPGGPILVSIESDGPVPVLFLLNHFVDRLQRHQTKQNPTGPMQPFVAFTEQDHDSIDINYLNILRLQNFMAISTNLHSILHTAMEFHRLEFKRKFEESKQALLEEHCRFHIATTTSISLGKRLPSLPDADHTQFASLLALTKQFQLNLLAKLQGLETMKRSDYFYSKFPRINGAILPECVDGFADHDLAQVIEV